MSSNSLELLMPAGSFNKMALALDYGADAVYLGPPFFSLRARENEFQQEKLKQAIDEVHSRRKKVYMTLNIFARNRKLKPFREEIEELASFKPDAFIMSDPGMISIARERAPQIPIHLSVQANCMNWESVKFWKKSLEVQRIILSRELAISEIAEIKQKVPDIELEAFVHGSICIAYSGRCLLSSYMDRRDANQGVCDNSCREKFKLFEDKDYYIEDANENPGQMYQMDEDEHGTYILNAKDLCMIEHLSELIRAGVVSFKVEGRTKSEFYAAMVARCYRGALEDCIQGKPFNPYWMEELHRLTHRGYHTAFMFENPRSGGQNYEASAQYAQTTKLLGVIKESSETSLTDIKHKIQKGQFVRIITPNGREIIDQVQKITTQKGQEKSEVHSGAGLFNILFKEVSALPVNAMILNHESFANKKTS